MLFVCVVIALSCFVSFLVGGVVVVLGSLGVFGVSVVTTTYCEVDYVRRFVCAVKSVLRDFPHEVIVVDDDSPDGTYEVARGAADVVIRKVREGQTKGLLVGIEVARYPVVVTLDVDLENPPELIPELLKVFLTGGYDVLVACRTYLPRFSERLASKLLSKYLGVRDVFSNFRVYRRECVVGTDLRLGETFGAELLLIAKSRGCRIGEYLYEPPPRRSKPRVGGKLVSNLRILKVITKLLYATKTTYRLAR